MTEMEKLVHENPENTSQSGDMIDIETFNKLSECIDHSNTPNR
jgi:hypothetical protein